MAASVSHVTTGRSQTSVLGKRKQEQRELPFDPVLKSEFTKQCRREFNRDPLRKMVSCAVAENGIEWVGTDPVEANKVRYIFTHSLIGPDTKALDQNQTGRCWMYAGSNMLRHTLIKALNVKNFEFSYSYWFFWDKYERSNEFLCDIIKTLDMSVEDRYMRYILKQPIEDGGWFNNFTNLIDKYGMVPSDVWSESGHSGFSSELNDQLNQRLAAAACHIRERCRKMTPEQLAQYRDKVMKDIYNILCTFLGEPPTADEKFTWSYKDRDHQVRTVEFSPKEFRKIGCPLDFKDFVVLGNFTNVTYNKVYEMERSCNIAGGESSKLLNVPNRVLKKAVLEQVLKGLPVWFGADVSRDAHYGLSALNEKLIDYDTMFGKKEPMTKSERLKYYRSTANHAMCITGVTLDEEGMPVKWQVENSWGYLDNETPGHDGYWEMTDKWFDENVFEAVVHKNLLPKSTREVLKQKPRKIWPWDPLWMSGKVS